jgi:hypothetical protein
MEGRRLRAAPDCPVETIQTGSLYVSICGGIRPSPEAWRFVGGPLDAIFNAKSGQEKNYSPFLAVSKRYCALLKEIHELLGCEAGLLDDGFEGASFEVAVVIGSVTRRCGFSMCLRTWWLPVVW